MLTGKPLRFPEGRDKSHERHGRSTGGLQGPWPKLQKGQRHHAGVLEVDVDMQSLMYLLDRRLGDDSKKAKAIGAQTLVDSFLCLTGLTSMVSQLPPPAPPPQAPLPLPSFLTIPASKGKQTGCSLPVSPGCRCQGTSTSRVLMPGQRQSFQCAEWERLRF